MGKTPGVEIEVQADLRLLLTDAEAVSIAATLRYNSADPYAVTMNFGGDGLAVQWVFGRDLLMKGMKGAVGLGDVRVWPGARRNDDAVFISLSSPDGQAVLQAPKSVMQDFLNKTYDVIQPGQETRHIDLDASLQHLLA